MRDPDKILETGHMPESAARELMERFRKHLDPTHHSHGEPIVVAPVAMVAIRNEPPVTLEKINLEARRLAARKGLQFHVETRGNLFNVFLYKEMLRKKDEEHRGTGHSRADWVPPY